jgi:hypothetical protein
MGAGTVISTILYSVNYYRSITCNNMNKNEGRINEKTVNLQLVFSIIIQYVFFQELKSFQDERGFEEFVVCSYNGT